MLLQPRKPRLRRQPMLNAVREHAITGPESRYFLAGCVHGAGDVGAEDVGVGGGGQEERCVLDFPVCGVDCCVGVLQD